MNKLYNIEYEKKYYISDEDMNEMERDTDKEIDIIIDKSLECADEVTSCINNIFHTKIADNEIDYDVHIKNNVVPVNGEVKVFVTKENALDNIVKSLERKDFIVSVPQLLSDFS